MCEVSRMDYSLISAIVSGLIFIIVLRMSYFMYFVNGMVKNTEEIIVEWNNRIHEITHFMTPADFEEHLSSEADKRSNEDEIKEWDNS